MVAEIKQFGFTPYVSAFLLTIFFIYMLRPIAFKTGLLDVPGGRKSHAGQVPLVGGIAMFSAFVFSFLLLPGSLSVYRSFLAGSALLVFVGVLDDFHELSHRSKFLFQIIAALFMACWGGIYLDNLGNLFFTGDVLLHNFAIPFSMVAIIAIINAVNMTDGMDGLAGSLTLVELALLLCLVVQTQNLLDAQIIILLITVVSVFLFFNLQFVRLSRVKIFMGDAGSMFLGFVISWFLIKTCQGPERIISPAKIVWIIALPMYEVMYSFIHRLLAGKSPFAADRKHLHHLFQACDVPVVLSVFSIAVMALFLGSFAVMAAYFRINDGYMLIGFVLLFIVYYLGMQWFWRRTS